MSRLLNILDEKLINLAKDCMVNKESIDHTVDHLKRVNTYAMKIAKNHSYFGQNVDKFVYNLKFLVYLHDIGRKTDKHEPYHGIVSSEMAKTIIPYFVEKNDFPMPSMDSISFGIKYHSCLKEKKDENGHDSIINLFNSTININKHLVETFWDADQLDHPRNDGFWRYLGKLNTNYLSTDFAKKFANSEEHLGIYKN
jgi:hypothetical protein